MKPRVNSTRFFRGCNKEEAGARVEEPDGVPVLIRASDRPQQSNLPLVTYAPGDGRG